MFERILPWSLQGIGPFLNTYGDVLFFRHIRRTPPIETNPRASTSVHSIVAHRFVYAYLVAVKSLLYHFSDVTVFVHDDGSLNARDRELIRAHMPEAIIIDRAEITRRFDHEICDPFLSQVRSSYTSYLKLFDPTFLRHGQRIILLDTDTLFLRAPTAVINWARNGGEPWYHLAPRGNMKATSREKSATSQQEPHIQTLIMNDLVVLNDELGRDYRLEQGFCAGFVGYSVDLVDFKELRELLTCLYAKFGDRIFRWGAEQAIHGLLLCGKGAKALPIQDYFVYTQNNAGNVANATFVHFVGENRFFRFRYPRLAARLMRNLAGS
jgi:lipopolysaccharide biosynthesis glycosyltransferase